MCLRTVDRRLEGCVPLARGHPRKGSSFSIQLDSRIRMDSGLLQRSDVEVAEKPWSRGRWVRWREKALWSHLCPTGHSGTGELQ